ncbi:zeta toxin family protein [Ottowia sp.]|uniref:zeta toxin family protein n=1 Tax=Ottowia sp. TaxID=1898956 RepID=UPI003A8512CA
MAWTLREAAMAERKHLIVDTTMPRTDVIRALQEAGYEVEVRAIATHRLESELGVDNRFTKDIDRFGHGRHVPNDVRAAVYKSLPASLDDVSRQTGVPIQIFDREGALHFDSRTTPHASPGSALNKTRFGRLLSQERLNEMHQLSGAQRQWHRDLPARLPNDQLDADTTRHLLDERQADQVERDVQRLHNEFGGYRAVRPTLKAAGVLGAAYGAWDAKGQVDAAIDSARSTRQQWINGSEETANQATKAAVTGGAAAVGAVPGAAAGVLTSAVTGPVGPVVGGLATGSAAAVGAEKLYEDSRLQQFSKYLGREAGELGYDYVSREGRLLRQVGRLQEALDSAADPAERARLQGRFDEASAAFSKEAERNGRYFEARGGIDRAWEQMHQRFANLDKDDVQDALDRHIDAGKRPTDAARGAYSDAVSQKYPYQMPHEPLEDYRALNNEQLADKHRQYLSEMMQGHQALQALQANQGNSHNNLDQGWPKELAQQRQAQRITQGLDEQWRDAGHLTAVRQAYKERGMEPPALPPELQPPGAHKTASEHKAPVVMDSLPAQSLDTLSRQLVSDSVQAVSNVANRHGLAWDQGMVNTAYAVAAQAKTEGMSRINLFHADGQTIRAGQYDGIRLQEVTLDSSVAANTPQAQSQQQMQMQALDAQKELVAQQQTHEQVQIMQEPPKVRSLGL